MEFELVSVYCLLIFCESLLTAISGNTGQQHVIFLTCMRPHFSQLYHPLSYAFLICSSIFDHSVSSHGNLYQPLSLLASLPGVSPLQNNLFRDRHPGYTPGVQIFQSSLPVVYPDCVSLLFNHPVSGPMVTSGIFFLCDYSDSKGTCVTAK